MPTLDLGSVVGPQGKQGEIGPEGKQGIQGPPGPAGTNPYDYAVAGGYTGTEAEFQAMMGSGPWVPETGFVPASNTNLLDNWYLGPGVINQRNILSEGIGTTPAGWHYTLDRWIEYSYGEWELIPEGLRLSGLGNYGPYFSLGQVVDRLGPRSTFPKPYSLTYSILIDNQVYSTTLTASKDNIFHSYLSGEINLRLHYRFDYNNNYPLFELSIYTGFLSSPITIKAVKLEIGTEQTLAHLDSNGNWVLNDPPPNQALELEKCQRYLRVLNSVGNANHQFGMGFAGGSDHVRIPYLIPVPMRANPTISYSGTFLAYKSSTTSTSQALNVTNLNAVAIDRESMLLTAYVNRDLTPGDIYLLRSGTTEAGKITLDANL